MKLWRKMRKVELLPTLDWEAGYVPLVYVHACVHTMKTHIHTPLTYGYYMWLIIKTHSVHEFFFFWL